jgi:hypothetical protein
VIVDGGGNVVVGSQVPLAPVASPRERRERAVPQTPPDLDTQTLWSGLERDGIAGASLTAPLPRPEGPSGLAIALVAVGALALVAGAIVARPRRRALAH